MSEEEDLRQCPAKAGEERGRHDKHKADGVEFCFASDHHDNAYGHGGDDGAELPRGLFEAEEECEEQNEGERGGFAHREEGEGHEAEGGITEADVKRRCSAAG